jgi:hypothetical protein
LGPGPGAREELVPATARAAHVSAAHVVPARARAFEAATAIGKARAIRHGTVAHKARCAWPPERGADILARTRALRGRVEGRKREPRRSRTRAIANSEVERTACGDAGDGGSTLLVMPLMSAWVGARMSAPRSGGHAQAGHNATLRQRMAVCVMRCRGSFDGTGPRRHYVRCAHMCRPGGSGDELLAPTHARTQTGPKKD